LLLFFWENGRMTGVIWPVESEFDGTLFWLTLFLPRRPSQTISQTNGKKKTRSHWIFYRVRRSACHFIVNESIYSTPTIQAGEPRGEVTARHFPIVETGITNKYSCWTIILIFEFRCFPLYNFLYTFLTFIFLTFSGSIAYVDRGGRMLQWYRDGPYCGTRR
jgi:hypothetical protein